MRKGRYIIRERESVSRPHIEAWRSNKSIVTDAIYRSETVADQLSSAVYEDLKRNVLLENFLARQSLSVYTYNSWRRKEKYIRWEIKKQQSFNVQSKMERGYSSAASTLISVSLARVLSETFYIKMLTQSAFYSFSTARLGYAFSWHAFTWTKKTAAKRETRYFILLIIFGVSRMLTHTY